MPLLIEETIEYQPPSSSVAQLSSNEMAAVALIVQSFMDMMFQEIQAVGFVNIEFLEKSELFLRAVTPSFPREEFDTLLEVFKKVDSAFEKTKFYYGLIVLRQICTLEKQADKALLQDMGFSIDGSEKVNSALIIFASHLVENIIQHIKHMRKMQELEHQPIEVLRYRITSQFNHCLLKTISEVTLTMDNVAH